MYIILIPIIIFLIYPVMGYKKPAAAVLSLPFVLLAAFIIYSSFYLHDEETAVISLVTAAVIIPTSAAILLSKKNLYGPYWPKTIATVTIIVFLVILAGAICFLLLTVSFRIFGPAALYFYFFFLLFIAFFTLFLSVSKQTTTTFILSTIGSSMRQNLPLPMALESAAAGRKDKHARILRKIKDWLVKGLPLSEAIKRGYPKCPSYVLGMVSAAEKINQLPAAFQSIENDLEDKAQENRRVKPFLASYPLMLALFMSLIILLLFKFVIPRLQELLHEMADAELPLSTRIIGEISGFVAFRYGWLFFIIALLIVLTFWVHLRYRPRQTEKPYLMSRIGDTIKWYLPIFHWFEKNYSMVHTFEILRLSLQSGSTVNAAIANTLNIDINICFKKRLANWLRNVEQGQNMAEAAAHSGIGTAFVWVFDNNTNTDTLSILEMLEYVYRSNYSYRIHLAQFILGPVSVIAMGAVVGFVVYACYIPYITILHHLCRYIVP